MTAISCPFCSHAPFADKGVARSHVKMDHPDNVEAMLTKLSDAKRAALSDPYEWAAGELLLQ
jgi:hypothetical protein